MKPNIPLLSICIPTFNRASILEKTLQSLTEDPYFGESDLVEIAVSDNGSTDNTAALVQSYAQRFPGKINYHRTPTNLLEGNFEYVLRKGRGTFRKLQNDSFGIQPGLLECLVRIIDSLQSQKPVVFLVNEEPKPDEDTLQHCQSMDEFLNAVSYKSTWIGGFGIWAEDLAQITDFSRAIDLKLTQTDVLMRMVARKKRSVVIKEFIQFCFWKGRKGGYNIAEVFGANYLSILKEHVSNGDLSQAAFAAEKKRVLIEHTLPFVFSKDHDFASDNLMHHLRDYVGEPYLMPALESAQSANERAATQPTPRRPAESFTQQWRHANQHNETSCTYPISLEKISVGRRTYGVITAMHWGHPDEYLKIGSFCSIGGGVEFLLGGNHALDGLSTFPIKVKYFGHAHEALTKGPIIIGDDVWIGNRATILSGTQIGQGAVIGACAVVSGHVPPYAIVAGNPAKIVRYRFSPEVIEKMLALNYDDVTDEAIVAMGARMNDPVTAANVDTYVRALMGKPSAEETPDSGHEFNTFPKQQSLPNAPVKIAFIGNSITLHGAAAEIGWRHQHGMAASLKEEDYCHRLLGLMNIPKENAFIGNFAEAERVDIQGSATTQFLADLLITKKPELTVIQLGDNVSDEAQIKSFQDNLYAIACLAKANSQQVLLLSTWWESAAKDRVIQNVAELTQSEYVYIGDLFTSPKNTDRKHTKYAHAGVDNHPREWGMHSIANRIHQHLLMHQL
jgi:acetyltransferase-like isoleucine patch superfamily enzyme/glycosyltransferase involved in cell wall biosynthesis